MTIFSGLYFQVFFISSQLYLSCFFIVSSLFRLFRAFECGKKVSAHLFKAGTGLIIGGFSLFENRLSTFLGLTSLQERQEIGAVNSQIRIYHLVFEAIAFLKNRSLLCLDLLVDKLLKDNLGFFLFVFSCLLPRLLVFFLDFELLFRISRFRRLV